MGEEKWSREFKVMLRYMIPCLKKYISKNKEESK